MRDKLAIDVAGRKALPIRHSRANCPRATSRKFFDAADTFILSIRLRAALLRTTTRRIIIIITAYGSPGQRLNSKAAILISGMWATARARSSLSLLDKTWSGAVHGGFTVSSSLC